MPEVPRKAAANTAMLLKAICDSSSNRNGRTTSSKMQTLHVFSRFSTFEEQCSSAVPNKRDKTMRHA
jgi:hypothetical protein